MKPSHLQTPRNLAECTFEIGYHCAYPTQEQPSSLGVVGSVIGAAVMIGIALMLMLAYFDVLVQ